jgi:L-fucose isomerase-like protein
VLELAKVVRRPILLWAFPELPYDGGKIRLNSSCGVNLNASNLYKAGVRDYYAIIQDRIDEGWVDAIRVCAALEHSHIGLAGFHAHGFYNLNYNELNTYNKLGLLVDHFELQDIFNTEVAPEAVEERKAQLLEKFDRSDITDEQLEKVAALAAKFEAFMDTNKLTALVVRCWPEFAAGYGVAPCAAMSLLQSMDRIIVCEGDVEGAFSMVAHRAVGAETPFLADLSQVNFEQDLALLWHCGVAPCNLWDGSSACSLDTYFAGGRGVTVGFVMKPGDISILRIDSAGQDYRVFLQKATGIPMEKELRGTYVKVTFPEPVRAVFDRIVYNGVAHHVSVVYGDFSRPLEIFTKIKGWTLIK